MPPSLPSSPPETQRYHKLLQGHNYSCNIVADLIERKHVAAERQAREDRDKKKTMELEEAFRDNTKITGIPREVRYGIHVYKNCAHIHMYHVTNWLIYIIVCGYTHK